MTCECCSHIWRAGEPQPRRIPARYRWVSATSGNVTYLCADCCAWWRRNAADDPSLAPSRITQVPELHGTGSIS